MKIWELIDLFKARCNSRGWKISDNNDLIFADGEYHNIIWTNRVYPSTFLRIVLNSRCVVKEGLSYRMVNTSYFAWVLPRSPPKSILETVISNPTLLRKTAIYDLSPLSKGERICFKVNETGSSVFNEFEKFLERELKIKLVKVNSKEFSNVHSEVAIFNKA